MAGILAIKARLVATVFAIGLAIGSVGWWLAKESRPAAAAETQSPDAKDQVDAPVKQEQPVATDQYGDPLPERALRRFGTGRFRHGFQIGALAISPNGTTLASAGSGEIRLWDSATGRLRKSLRTTAINVFSLGFSNDGSRLVSCGGVDEKAGQLEVWDVAAGKPLRTVAHPAWVRSAALTPDGKTIAMACDDGTLRLLDGDSGAVRHNLGSQLAVTNAVAFSPDGRLLAARADANTICLWDVATGGKLRVVLQTNGMLRALVFSPDGTKLALAYDNGMKEATICLCDLANGQEVWTIHIGAIQKLFFSAVFALAFSPDGRQVASGDINGTVEVWDAKTGKSLRQAKEGRQWIQGVAFSPEGRTLYSAGSDGFIQARDTASGNARSEFDQHTGAVLALSQSPDGRTLATAAGDRTIRLWDLATGKTRSALKGHAHQVCTVHFLRDPSRVISAGDDGTVWVWDAVAGKELHKLVDSKKSWSARVALSPNGKLLAIGEVQRVRLWDFAAGKVVRQFTGHQGYIGSLSFSADGAFLTTSAYSFGDDNGAHNDDTVRVWQVATGEELFRHSQPSNCPVFTPDGRGVAFLSGGKVLVYDFVSGKERPSPGWSDVQSMAPSRGCSWLATAHHDGFICIRAAGNGQEILRLQTNVSHIYHLLWAADGKKLYSANGDTTVLEWDLAPAGGRSKLTGDQAWIELASADGPTAYRAAWWFLTAADPAAELKTRLTPVPPWNTPENIPRLIGELDDDNFAVRESATNKLAALGSAAESALIKALATSVSLEQRLRLKGILKNLVAGEVTADEWRSLRRDTGNLADLGVGGTGDQSAQADEGCESSGGFHKSTVTPTQVDIEA